MGVRFEGVKALLLMVMFLLVVSVDRDIPAPGVKVTVSLLEPAVMVDPLAEIFLKMSCEEPRSELERVLPERESPLPKVKAPDVLASEVTPELLRVFPVREIPDPIVMAPVELPSEVTPEVRDAEMVGF